MGESQIREIINPSSEQTPCGFSTRRNPHGACSLSKNRVLKNNTFAKCSYREQIPRTSESARHQVQGIKYTSAWHFDLKRWRRYCEEKTRFQSETLPLPTLQLCNSVPLPSSPATINGNARACYKAAGIAGEKDRQTADFI